MWRRAHRKNKTLPENTLEKHPYHLKVISLPPLKKHATECSDCPPHWEGTKTHWGNILREGSAVKESF